MANEIFEKEAFIKSVKNNVKSLFRKDLTEASQQEIYQAVSFVVAGYTEGDGYHRPENRILHVHGISGGACTWQQSDQPDIL